MKNSCFFAFLLILNTLCAQPALISWELKDGNKGDDFFTKSIQLSNGNLAVIGNVTSPDGSKDMAYYHLLILVQVKLLKKLLSEIKMIFKFMI